MRVQLAILVVAAFLAVSRAEEEASSAAPADAPAAESTAAPTTPPPALENKVKKCCEGLNAGDALNCEALSKNDQEAIKKPSPELFKYFYTCVANSKDNTKCCQDKKVSDECLPVCNAASPPAFEDSVKLAGKCKAYLKQALGTCARGGKERVLGALLDGALNLAGGIWDFATSSCPGLFTGCRIAAQGQQIAAQNEQIAAQNAALQAQLNAQSSSSQVVLVPARK